VAFCPRCKSTNVKDSLYRVRDIPSLLTGFKPLRCVCCHHRFKVWRLFRERIREKEEPGTQMVLVRKLPPMVVGREAAMAASAAAAASGSSPRILPVPQDQNQDLSGSLLNLFSATSQHGPGIRTNRPLFRKRIVEADFSASLASAAMAVAQDGSPAAAKQPVNTTTGYRPPTGPENRRKGDRPPMHMASRPIPPIRTSPPLARPAAAAPATATHDEYQTVRR
jgi:hypothetical protein